MELFSTHTLGHWFTPVTIAAFFLGGLGLVAALISALMGYEVADRLQKELDIKIAETNRQTELLIKDTAQANERAAKYEKDAAQARLEMEKLRAQLVGRRLNASQMNIIGSHLNGLKINLSLAAIVSDAESMTLALDVQAVLKRAGFDLDIQSSPFVGKAPLVGIIIDGPKADMLKVGEAFTKAGFNVTGQVREGDVQILIGSKPSVK